MEKGDDFSPETEGFHGYEPTSVDPSPWLLLVISGVCIFAMLIVVPIAVTVTKIRCKNLQAVDATSTTPGWWWAVLSFDDETQKILRLGLPYTFSNVSFELFFNVCLILVSQCIGTKHVAAYALVHILVELTDGVLCGPIYSCNTLCAHAIGAGNPFLAGQYIQLAIILYIGLNVPVVILWWNYMYDVIQWLQWGDEVTAQLAQTFIQSFIWSRIIVGIMKTIWQILEITDHAAEVSLVIFLHGAFNMGFIAVFAITSQMTLFQVGLIFTATALLFLGVTLIWAQQQGWLVPFNQGIKSPVITNFSALKAMIHTATPLALSELSSNAEWAALTVFASCLGPAEVATWAILGSIWDLFYNLSSGFGQAAEVRTSLHLVSPGNLDSYMRKL